MSNESQPCPIPADRIVFRGSVGNAFFCQGHVPEKYREKRAQQYALAGTVEQVEGEPRIYTGRERRCGELAPRGEH